MDHLNTTRLIQDQAGNTVWRWDQGEPFGNDVPNSNPSGTGAFDFPLRFPGQYFDRETNLAYNYFRDYDPATGRYTESDPAGLKAGLNTYAYVRSNPLRWQDRIGLFGEWPDPSGPPPMTTEPLVWPYNNWYGNWCGPGGGGATINGVDCACKKHDQCYDKCGLSAGNRWVPPQLFSPCAAHCDADLITHPTSPDCGNPPCKQGGS